MTDLWGFFLQTMEVSWTALFLLILKRLLADKLSPRWQYGIWSLLFFRLLVPAGVTERYLLTFPAVALQAVRESAESVLSSRFCTAAAPVQVTVGLPWISGRPQSITDWLFVFYVAGVIFCLGKYFISYLCLRLLLRSGQPVSSGLQTKLDTLCDRCHLKPCRAVLLPDLPSAFICGVFSPVLAVPSEEIDDKILLHELLHLRSMDTFQSIVWSIFRSVHWCNPFLQYVFNRIGNDMESLCDQRVLERLEGEERRRYGEILLDMTNDRYPRAPGTTSLSNGGRNIRRRIAAITRFRKYPRGMGLVSLCIAVTLLFPLLSGVSPVTLPGSADSPGIISGGSFLNRSFPGRTNLETAAAHLVHCKTAAGVLDTFAKGLMYQNSVWLTASGSASDQGQTELLLDTVKTGNLQFDGSFYLYNPVPQGDGTYQVLLVFPTDHLYPGTGSAPDVSSRETFPTDTACQEPQRGYYVFPAVLLCDTGGNWSVKASGDYRSVLSEDSYGFCAYGSDDLPALTAEKKGTTGTFARRSQLIYTVQQPVSSPEEFSGTRLLNDGRYPDFSSVPDTDAEFSAAFCMQNFQWTASETFLASGSDSHAEMYVTFPDKVTGFSSDLSRPLTGLAPVENEEDASFTAGNDLASASWNGSLHTGGGSSFDWSGPAVPFPTDSFCRIDISFDGELQESAIFSGKEGNYS